MVPSNLTSKETRHEGQWEIGPATSIFNLKLAELWEYRDLWGLLVRRDFVAFYKQTVFGPIWFFIQPLFTTVLFTVVFKKIGHFSTENTPAPLFYLCGTIAWNYFSDCINKTSSIFRDNAYLFGKIYFPRLVLPLSIVASNLVRFAVQFVLFVGLLAYYIIKDQTVKPNAVLFLVPLVIVLIGFLGLGLGLMVTALTTKYRDMLFVVNFGMQLMMYATPVIYPLSAVPAEFKWIIALNPLSGMIETFRCGFLGTARFDGGLLCYSAVVAVAVCYGGLLLFNRAQNTFVDTI